MKTIDGQETNQLISRLKTMFKVKTTDDLIKLMVNRFLNWKLPENFSPDAGIAFTPEYNVEYMASLGKPPSRHEPQGTNLLDADQATKMVKHMLGIKEGL